MKTMILLVGEQPAPNLLPMRHFNPSQVLLVYSGRTEKTAKRLQRVIGSQCQTFDCPTDAYRVEVIRQDIQTQIAEHKWQDSDLRFNLTGGTKTMVIAAYEVARMLDARAFYYQTEDNQSLLHLYRFEHGELICESPELIQVALTLDDHLRLYVGDYHTGRLKEGLELMIEQVLRQRLPEYEILTSVKLIEVAGNLEVDLMVGYHNQVAVLESKRQGKKGIDQLNSVANQRTLGTYTKKILVSQAPLDGNNQDLAQAYNIRVATLPSAESGTLSQPDQDTLIQTIRDAMEQKLKSPRPVIELVASGTPT